MRLLVVGGGVAGLAAAHRALELARERGAPLELTLVEARERLGGRPGMGHEQDGLRAVLARVDELVGAIAVVIRLGTAERARLILRARLTRDREHDLAARVDARVVVVAEIGRRDAVAHEHDVGFRGAVLRHAQRREVRAERERLRGSGHERQAGRGAEPDTRRHGHGLEVRPALARGREPGVAEGACDVPGSALGADGARLAPLHVRGAERAHLIEDPRGGGKLDRAGGRGQREDEDEQRRDHFAAANGSRDELLEHGG